MNSELATLATALWLGIVTSVSPCPLATNVAAVSVLARRVGERRRALAGAAAYTLGRMAVYLALALILSGGLATMPKVAAFLRTEIGPLVGPILVLAGMALLGWLPLPLNLRLGDGATAQRVSRWGLLGEFCLGGLLALSFCPVSAALFFGSLVPLALPSTAPPLTVGIYGLGTALPVGVIAIFLVLSTEAAARALGRLQAWQGRLTRGTAIVLLLVGVYLTLTQTILPIVSR